MYIDALHGGHGRLFQVYLKQEPLIVLCENYEGELMFAQMDAGHFIHPYNAEQRTDRNRNVNQ
jgi:hypothetical protein